MGGALVALVLPPLAAVAPPGRSELLPFVGLAAAFPPLLVLLRARPRDALPGFATAALAFSAGHVIAPLVRAEYGPPVGAAVAALVLGMGSNAYARFADRPAALVMVPGILLLVPGSMGFRSVTSFLRRDVIAAVHTAFEVGLVAGALVAGLLVANIVLPPRKAL